MSQKNKIDDIVYAAVGYRQEEQLSYILRARLIDDPLLLGYVIVQARGHGMHTVMRSLVDLYPREVCDYTIASELIDVLQRRDHETLLMLLEAGVDPAPLKTRFRRAYGVKMPTEARDVPRAIRAALFAKEVAGP